MRGFLTVLIICLLLGGVFVFLYVKYKPEGNSQEYNVSISAEYNNKKIVTGYRIETNQGIIEGNTSQVYELEKLSGNVKIYNINLENQTFYRDYKELNLTQDTRVDLKLEKPQPISIIQTEEKDKIILNVTSRDSRNLKFCLDWSFAYIFVEYEGGIGNLGDDCYGIFDLKDSTEQINITFKEFTPPKESDYIKINFIYNDFIDKLDKIVKIK